MSPSPVTPAQEHVLALLSAGSTLTAHSQEQAAQLAALATDAIRKILTDPSTPAHVRLKAALAILDKVTVFSAVSASQRSLREPTESMPNPDPQSDKTNPPPETPAQNAQSTKTNPPRPGRNEPCPCGSGREPEPAPEPEEQVIVHKPAQNAQSTKTNPQGPGRNEPCPCGSGREPEPAPEPEEQVIVHKPAQNAQSTKTNPPRPGRNEPCPCGSGRKFKRCCIDGPQAAAA